MCYLLLHIIIFALFAALINPSFRDISDFLSKLKSPSGLFPLLSFPLAIVLEGLIHSDRKAILVFWRIKNPLPGSRAFSVIAHKDPRIDLNKLREIIPDGFPESPRDQNTKWYKLYREYSERPTVYDAHKSFLLTRDLVALTIVLIPFSLVAHLFWGTKFAAITYHIVLLLAMAIISSLSSKHHGERFVANVLVEATL